MAKPEEVMHNKNTQAELRRLAVEGTRDELIKAAADNYIQESLPTLWGNMLGTPAVTIPNLNHIRDGIPVGCTLMTRTNDMELLLQTGLEIDHTLEIGKGLKKFHAKNQEHLVERALEEHREKGTTKDLIDITLGTWKQRTTPTLVATDRQQQKQ